MCKVNFVSEFNMLMRYARNNGLTGRERLLWIALFTIANDRAIYNEQTKEYDWPEDLFPVPNGELTLQSTLDKRGIETVRNSLKQRGLIDFVPGMKNKKMPMYKLLYLSIDVGYKTVPNPAPNRVPNNDTNNVPNIAPNSEPSTPPNPASTTSGFGYKNAPNNVPFNVNQRERNTEYVRGRRNVAQTPDGSIGLVDLDAGFEGSAGLVPLPWETDGEAR